MIGEATPRPWHDRPDGAHPTNRRIFGANGQQVCKVYASDLYDADGQARANSLLIYGAVNARYRLQREHDAVAELIEAAADVAGSMAPSLARVVRHRSRLLQAIVAVKEAHDEN